MATLNDLKSQFTAYTEALDRVADKIADIKNEPEVKAALVRQYEELRKLKSKIENQISVEEFQKSIN